MRATRALLVVCLLLGLGAVAGAGRGHLRDLRRSLEEGEEQATRHRLRERAEEVARLLRERLAGGDGEARYTRDGRLLRPAPPAEARPFEPPAGTITALYLAAGNLELAEKAARTSQDRAAVLLRRNDPASLRKALHEQALQGTEMAYRVRLELAGGEPDGAWRDDVSALLEGGSDRFARALLREAGCEPVGDPERRRWLALQRVRPGFFPAQDKVFGAREEEDGIVLRSVPLESLELGAGPLAQRLKKPFDFLEVRGAPRAVSVQTAGLVLSYGLAACILLAGTVYAYVAIGRAHRLARDKSDFVANVTHELKTPLANILLYAESLRDGRVQDRDRDSFLLTILEEGRRLDALVEGLLHAARGPRLAMEPVDVQALVRDAESRWRARLEEGGCAFEVLAPELPPVRGDREALLRAVGNLLDNARKYARAPKRVALTACADDDSVRVTVRDSGPGIPVGERARVLQPFARLEAADRKETPGAGLGLSLVAACMEAHGGTVEIADGITLVLKRQAK